MRQLDSNDWTTARKLAKRLADSRSVSQPSDTCARTRHCNQYGELALQPFNTLQYCATAR
jgi:hypothetical protein